MTEKQTGRRAKAKSSSRVQWPWSRRRWMAEEYYANRDRELDLKVEKAGKGLLPYGYYEDRTGLAISALPHNPYLGLPFVPLQVWVGLFLYDKLSDAPPAAIGLAAFFGLGGLIVLLSSVLRIPGWHRARVPSLVASVALAILLTCCLVVAASSARPTRFVASRDRTGASFPVLHSPVSTGNIIGIASC